MNENWDKIDWEKIEWCPRLVPVWFASEHNDRIPFLGFRHVDEDGGAIFYLNDMCKWVVFQSPHAPTHYRSLGVPPPPNP